MLEFQYFCNMCEKVFPIQTSSTVKEIKCPYCGNKEQNSFKLLECKATNILRIPKK